MTERELDDLRDWQKEVNTFIRQQVDYMKVNDAVTDAHTKMLASLVRQKDEPKKSWWRR